MDWLAGPGILVVRVIEPIVIAPARGGQATVPANTLSRVPV